METVIAERKTVLITGATSGIGFSAATQLAALGHSVVIVGRNREKCTAAAEGISRQTGRDVDWLAADLASQAQVRRLAGEFQQRYANLDVLINNAGRVSLRRTKTEDGLEQSWAVNLLQAFLLTHLLLDLLKASAPARIVNLTSVVHWAAQLHAGSLQERGRYIGWSVYVRCKLASLLFTYELARLLEGSGVTANTVHPGLVKTGIGTTSGGFLRSIMGMVSLFSVTPGIGAARVVNLAVNQALETVTGQYFSGMKAVRSSPASYNGETALQLWAASEKLAGIQD